MNKLKAQSPIQNIAAISLIIGIAVILRIMPHPANMAPIAAMALFGGATLDRKYALIIPLIALFVSDLIIGLHGTMLFVYGGFILTGLIGMWLKKHYSVKTIVLSAVVSSILFFLITNFGVWIEGELYPTTLQGLLSSYMMGIPFLKNTLIGDLFYTGAFFGSYTVVKRISVRFAF